MNFMIRLDVIKFLSFYELRAGHFFIFQMGQDFPNEMQVTSLSVKKCKSSWYFSN